jgi:hypothetical protein
MYDLARFSLTDMTRCGAALRRTRADASSMEEVANRIVRHLWTELRSPASGEPSCAMIRFYKTHPYGALEPDQRESARAMLGGAAPRDETMCLTLLASVGEEPAWNDRQASAQHRAIPLPSAEMLQQAPMIARLIAQFGVEAGALLAPDPAFVAEAEQRTYNVFYVPNALGSPYIPAQEFVRRYGVRSVLGFGGVLRTGELFAVILFAKTEIPDRSADLFKTLALNTKLAVTPFARGRIFA